MSDTAKWYVIHTQTGYENKVAGNLATIVENRHLQDWIQDICVPTETVVEVRDNKSREVERKLFPCYVFVKMIMNNDSWYVVRNVRGCTGFVGPNGDATPLTDEEIARFGVEKRVVEVRYKVGDTVLITAGPLANFTGIVEEINTEENKVRVRTSMFGRETPVDLELNQVSPTED